MPQYFTPRSNAWIRRALWGGPPLLVGLAAVMVVGARSSYVTGEGQNVAQPVPFPHDIHAGQLGLDCRYCHESVEDSAFAGMPGAGVCMDCHDRVWTGLDELEPVRASYRSRIPLAWMRVHDLPDYARFDHSIHVAKGVGCVSCHGRVDEMTQLRQTESLLMEWCLECHREPVKHLRPVEYAFGSDWELPDDAEELAALSDKLGISPSAESPAEFREALAARYGVQRETSCSICHQ
jgi:hypothetical protein